MSVALDDSGSGSNHETAPIMGGGKQDASDGEGVKDLMAPPKNLHWIMVRLLCLCSFSSLGFSTFGHPISLLSYSLALIPSPLFSLK